jgi:Ca2+-transporting ATPase
MKPHAQPTEDVLLSLCVDAERGLDPKDVCERQRQFGANALDEAAPEPAWRRLLAQFNEFVIWILIVAAVISGLMGEWSDAIAILAIVLLNGILGFIQEERAGRALAALQRMSAPSAHVLRGGVLQTIPARDLVPGDCIELNAGDNVPADARLLHTTAFRVQEATLTGESVPVGKDARSTTADDASLGDRRNMAYQGTVVAAGKARSVVVAIGMDTELGRIAGMLKRAEPEPTPLQRRLAELGKILVWLCLGIVGVIFVLGLVHGERLLEVFLLSISLAVAAVPEGLPAVVTMALALGLQRMVKRNALIRKLPSVETLGCVTVICSDKTGTLTRNEMTVREINAGFHRYEVTGAGYAPHGDFRRRVEDGRTELIAAPAEPDLMLALTIAARCNDARLVRSAPAAESWKVLGDPTEGALLVAARKAGLVDSRPDGVIREIPFDSERKRMSVVIEQPTGKKVMYCKGAPEVLLGRCTSIRVDGQTLRLRTPYREQVLQDCADMAAAALRVLALAYREIPAGTDSDDAETDMIFVGLVGMIDPPREEAKAAVERCRSAGIRPVMITGDHPATALAIGRELGIVTAGDHALTGQELDRLSDEELRYRVEKTAVYARVTAEHKLRIIQAWKARGQIVAMTGDGVNDAPAIKTADIGIAMGRGGTDVTREAADMVLTDDNFASIVNAVEEGRAIFDNIQKVLQYLLSCNFGEILLMLVAGLLGWPAPLVPIHLLWINLVTDGLPALALALEPAEPGVMQRSPRQPRDSILPWSMGVAILFQGALVGIVALLAFGISYTNHPEDIDRARSMAFNVLVFAELLRAIAARSWTLPIARLGFFTNPYLLAAIVGSVALQIGVVTLSFARPVFDTVNHSSGEWLLLAILAMVPMLAIELSKYLRVIPGAATSTPVR